MDNNTPNWWSDLYDDNLANILLESKDKSDAEATLQFLQNIVGLKHGQHVLDQCCGTGRISELLSMNHTVIGVDIIPRYIDIARSKISRGSSNAQYFCDDALTFYLRNPVDLAINWWTGFGYSEDDNINIKMLEMAYSSLRVGGLYALDFMNVPGIYRGFQRDVMTSVDTPAGELTLVRRSEIDFVSDTLLKEWRYFCEGTVNVSKKSAVRLYTPGQLSSMFKRVGFKSIKLYGDLGGGPLTLDSPRCIVVGEK